MSKLLRRRLQAKEKEAEVENNNNVTPSPLHSQDEQSGSSSASNHSVQSSNSQIKETVEDSYSIQSIISEGDRGVVATGTEPSHAIGATIGVRNSKSSQNRSMVKSAKLISSTRSSRSTRPTRSSRQTNVRRNQVNEEKGGKPTPVNHDLLKTTGTPPQPTKKRKRKTTPVSDSTPSEEGSNKSGSKSRGKSSGVSAAKKIKVPPPPSPALSTSTTTTAQPTNVFDAVLGEASDLLKAAQEAQACGRLKMASAYQLLVHARLVGLGKRFDRAICDNGNGSRPIFGGGTRSGVKIGKDSINSMDTTETPSTPSKESNSASNSSFTAVQALAKYIPPGEEPVFDNGMMEHLARAAMDLHNKRTGRGKLHERAEQAKLLAEVEKQQQFNNSSNKKGASAASRKKDKGGSVAWTEEEKQKCISAAQTYGRDNTAKIAKAVGSRTEAQIRAHLRNVVGRERVERDLAATTASSKSEENDGDAEEVGKEEEKGSNVDRDDKDSEDSPEKAPKRGGRGKKPPTRAMHTVPNANFDARSMLLGSL